MKKTLLLTFLVLLFFSSNQSYSQGDPFIGEVKLFAGNFAPTGWAFCDGQLLQISSNTALFSILGTIYGGDGQVTFGLPDLRGRVPVGPRTGPGLSNVNLGAKGGVERVVLTTNELPSHTHSATTGAAAPIGRGKAETSPTGNYWGDGNNYASAKNIQMANDAVSIGNTGASASHENRQPYLGLNYIIALTGTFPTQN